jgi:hypothetical protein
MINVQSILSLQEKSITDWHNKLILTQQELPWVYIEENNMWNFLLWHEEDIARIENIEPIRIVEAKRTIDKYNQSRNNSIERIDEWILQFLQSKNFSIIADIHSETPGMMIDRLSIMALKKFHMIEETIRPSASIEHKKRCCAKLSILDEQIIDLSDCLKKVFILLETGKLRFKVYRQFKMYNDPELNPELYKRVQLHPNELQ